MDSYVVAIDLGSTKVVSLVGEKIDDANFRILAYNETLSQGSIDHGHVVVPRRVADAVTQTLTELEKTLAQTQQASIITEVKDVFVNITGRVIKYCDYTTSTLHEDPDKYIEGAELKKLELDAYKMHTEAGEEVRHVIPQTYTIDGLSNITDPEGRVGNNIKGHFHVIVGDQESSKRIKMSLSQIGLNVKQLIFDPLASTKAVLNKDEMNVGVAIIDIGGGTTKLMTYYGGILRHTAVIPLGGESITNDIAYACGILVRDAETVKKRYGSCMPSMVNVEQKFAVKGIGNREDKIILVSDIAKIINARMSEIMEMVSKEIEKSKKIERFEYPLGAGIVLTGGSAGLHNICDFVRMKMGMYVKVGIPEYVSSDSIENIKQPEYATVVGLLMYGFVNGEKNADKIHQPKSTTTEPKPKSLRDKLQKWSEAAKQFFSSKQQEEEV